MRLNVLTRERSVKLVEILNVLVIYDSKSGNTEKMAHAIAEGAASEGAEVIVKKIGEPFPLTKLVESDMVVLGSPVIYADVSSEMNSFLESVKRFVNLRKIDMKGKRAAIFGSYGWDGAWTMEEQFKKKVQDLGYIVDEKVCVEVGTEIKYHPDATLENCGAFGKKLADSLK